MHRFSRLVVTSSMFGALLLGGCASSTSTPTEKAALDEPARRYDGYASFGRPVTTRSAEAQAWFDQGMQLLYGFNHDEAIRSFHEAASVDPSCAMAWWGVAYASGLHINNPEMTDEKNRLGWEAAQKAVALAGSASDPERALIRAVARRYEWPAPADRRRLDEAYADAMREAHGAFPSDPDIAALYAESLMNLQPWDYWTADGQPKGKINEIVGALESALALHPDHPGANHFYIHAVEASSDPDRAVPAAERLGTLVPGSGHLVHMPSHIYARVGRYTDASDANVRAIEADHAYFSVAPPPRFYRLYYMHNVHFLAFASMMEGRYDVALDAARRIEREVPESFLRENATFADGFMPTPLHVMIRFGRWDDVLKEPAPPAYRHFSVAMHHYARGVALAALGRTGESRRELASLRRAAADVPEAWTMGNNTCRAILEIALRMHEGELSFHEGKRERCFELLREAVTLEDALRYDEPPGWMHPVRHALGALLVADHRYAEAEALYREDLERNRENGWALTGLEQSLRAQGKTAQADAVASRRQQAWARADVSPVSSCFCQPALQ
jgi:tetratricopeptide (TPR) repeat protein